MMTYATVYIGFEPDPISVSYESTEDLRCVKHKALVQAEQDTNLNWIVKNEDGEVLNEFTKLGVLTPTFYIVTIPLIE